MIAVSTPAAAHASTKSSVPVAAKSVDVATIERAVSILEGLSDHTVTGWSIVPPDPSGASRAAAEFGVDLDESDIDVSETHVAVSQNGSQTEMLLYEGSFATTAIAMSIETRSAYRWSFESATDNVFNVITQHDLETVTLTARTKPAQPKQLGDITSCEFMSWQPVREWSGSSWRVHGATSGVCDDPVVWEMEAALMQDFFGSWAFRAYQWEPGAGPAMVVHVYHFCATKFGNWQWVTWSGVEVWGSNGYVQSNDDSVVSVLPCDYQW
jgi:hypothetical protein